MQQDGRHGGVDAAGQPADDALLADALADARDRSSMNASSVQVPLQPQIEKESCGGSAAARVHDLGMELHADVGRSCA